MILVGQYDSPFVRRVAISLRVLGFAYDHDTRSVFGDFDAMRTVNPLARIPSLTLDSGETLIDSAAILDWLDREVGPERALLPAAGAERTRAMQIVALATGAVEKFGAVNYERIIRPAPFRWPDWIERCRTQAMGALAALERETWDERARLDQQQITTGCLLGYLDMSMPDVLKTQAYPKLTRFWTRCAGMPEFIATSVDHYALPPG
jgi:glutathione S-transferase